jgi:hypothetical protein
MPYIRWTRPDAAPLYLCLDPWRPNARTWTTNRKRATRLDSDVAAAKLDLVCDLYAVWVVDGMDVALRGVPPLDLEED